jgi:hypothetical protein
MNQTDEGNKVWKIAGIVDAYGAVHFAEQRIGGEPVFHEELWPNAQKRWTFILSEWEITKSCLSKENLTPEDCEAIGRAIRKKHTPPRWYLWGEFWDKHGRPQHGKKRDSVLKKFQKLYGPPPHGYYE